MHYAAPISLIVTFARFTSDKTRRKVSESEPNTKDFTVSGFTVFKDLGQGKHCNQTCSKPTSATNNSHNIQN